MQTLKDEMGSLELGAALHFRNLTVFPLLRPEPAGEDPGYDLLDDVMARGTARVTEIHNGGSVPELRFENFGDRPVLLLDGEELVGAKQNRVLNLTILVAARQSVHIPVSCVEAGRWRMEDAAFRPSENVMFPKIRARRTEHVTASIRSQGTRRSDQGDVWDGIACMADRMESPSPTGAMNAIYEKHGATLDQYVQAFEWQPRQAGILFSTGGPAFGLDLLDHSAPMRRLHPKLIRSYALDAIDNERQNVAPAQPAARERAESFLGRLAEAPVMAEPAIALGKDVRLVSPALSGGALWAEDRYVHICAFSAEQAQAGPSFRTRMNRPSSRR
jgi:hypothetical protein